jgi:hypothetical protein
VDKVGARVTRKVQLRTRRATALSRPLEAAPACDCKASQGIGKSAVCRRWRGSGMQARQGCVCQARACQAHAARDGESCDESVPCVSCEGRTGQGRHAFALPPRPPLARGRDAHSGAGHASQASERRTSECPPYPGPARGASPGLGGASERPARGCPLLLGLLLFLSRACSWMQSPSIPACMRVCTCSRGCLCACLPACVRVAVCEMRLSGNQVEEVLWDKYGITLEDMAAAGCVPPPPQLLSLRMTESEYVPPREAMRANHAAGREA